MYTCQLLLFQPFAVRGFLPQVLDVAYNRLQGSVPGCLLNSLEQLYVPGNALSGSLPAPAATSPLTTLYANAQRGGGLSGQAAKWLFAAVDLWHRW
jgi:hypothetical protein